MRPTISGDALRQAAWSGKHLSLPLAECEAKPGGTERTGVCIY